MTPQRVLVAVDDSPAALRAARLAITLAAGWGARVRAVTVLTDHALAQVLDATTPGGSVEERLAAAARTVLSWVTDLAAQHDVPVEVALLEGEPFRRILEDAEDYDADLIVMGRSDRRGPTSPYIGSETEHVLEFTDRPVLVVPRRAVN